MDNTESIIKGIEIIYKELNKHYHKIKPINKDNISENDLLIKKK